eukprot:TRINITY_DN327_c0_g1_i4.p1 TRINITY_DN327_c0_g1~~TRINITY_DN327_c0_g1_i4.p1  ORF type:complete len:105 (-),score=22.58 TRINITY_DN327_c0_g1_i4:171-485(-)
MPQTAYLTNPVSTPSGIFILARYTSDISGIQLMTVDETEQTLTPVGAVYDDNVITNLVYDALENQLVWTTLNSLYTLALEDIEGGEATVLTLSSLVGAIGYVSY